MFREKFSIDKPQWMPSFSIFYKLIKVKVRKADKYSNRIQNTLLGLHE